ncbi:MAG: hypothetical protein JNK05_21690 [Myxococcales bacterium]|nr:hypothetical protein [Myxococcales bacterium]
MTDRETADAPALDRLRVALAELDESLAIPDIAPLDPGPERRVSDAWRRAMRERAQRLEPTAFALIDLWIDAPASRRDALAMIDRFRMVLWQWPSVISIAVERALVTRDARDFARLCASIALYDSRAQSRESWMQAADIARRLDESGVDSRAIFQDGIALCVDADAFDGGARALFEALIAERDEG